MLGWCSVLVIALVAINSFLGRPWGYAVVTAPYIFYVCFHIIFYMVTTFVQYERKRRWFEEAELYDKDKR